LERRGKRSKGNETGWKDHLRVMNSHASGYSTAGTNYALIARLVETKKKNTHTFV